MRLSILFMLSLTSSLCLAQPDTLITVFGVAKDAVTGERIKNISVVAVDDTDPQHTVQARIFDDGRYDLSLTEIHTYRIVYSAPGHVSKSVELDMNGPSEEDWKGGFGLQIDASLIEYREGIDLSALEQPFGRSTYQASTGNFVWDQEYSAVMRQKQEEILKAYNKNK